MTLQTILKDLKARRNPDAIAGMARFGIHTSNTYGVSAGELRELAKTVGRDHALANELWVTGLRDARILAAFIDDPAEVDAAQMRHWVADFDSWDVCDGCCIHLFRKTKDAHAVAGEWTADEREFVRRAGFAMIATLAVHDKKALDAVFLTYLEAVRTAAGDDRNFVKKAVNWALRQIGKRNLRLHTHALLTAEDLALAESRSARWIARDALRELRSEKTIARIKP